LYELGSHWSLQSNVKVRTLFVGHEVHHLGFQAHVLHDASQGLRNPLSK